MDKYDTYQRSLAHKDLVNTLKQLNETLNGIHDRLNDIGYELRKKGEKKE